MPECKSKESIKEVIEDNGGIVYDLFEAYTFQVKPDKEANDAKDFHTGKVFSYKWITDSISQGKFLDNSKYLLGFNKNPQRKTLPKGRTAYTITEILQMLDFVEKQKQGNDASSVGSIK